MVREASATIKAPIVMFTYYNPIMARGLDKFCQQAKEAGASGAAMIPRRSQAPARACCCLRVRATHFPAASGAAHRSRGGEHPDEPAALARCMLCTSQPVTAPA